MRRASAGGANSQRRRFKVCSYKSVGAPSNRGHLKRSVGINKSINKKKRALSIRLDKATHSWPQSVACFSRDVNVVGSRSEESTCPHPSILSPLPPPRCTVVVQDEHRELPVPSCWTSGSLPIGWAAAHWCSCKAGITVAVFCPVCQPGFVYDVVLACIQFK